MNEQGRWEWKSLSACESVDLAVEIWICGPGDRNVPGWGLHSSVTGDYGFLGTETMLGCWNNG